MSRNDSHDYDYPPGLSFLRNGNIQGDRESMNAYHHSQGSVSYSPSDRRPSVGTAGYPAYPSSMPRSLGMADWEQGFESGPNRNNPAVSNSQPFSSFNHQRPSPQIPQNPAGSLYNSLSFSDRDPHFFRNAQATLPQSPPNTAASRSTLWWGELEPWMDEEYANQVCALMGWDPVNIKVPHPAPDPATGQQANNPGYCFLTFPSPAHAASVLAQINNSGSNAPVTMPNSAKPFSLNWAASVQTTTPTAASFPAGPQSPQQYPKEYSIFVGDLAPETSNSDLVAVFRNPVLGLRNDREPKFIKPFLSCKSAKIMLDPVTGVSRGYGFVRFTDEADQQRALIEMHGLYCLSRPMRISPATAKFKPPPTISSNDLPQVQFPPPLNGGGVEQQQQQQQHPQAVTLTLPLPSSTHPKSVSAPIAATSSASSLNSHASGSSSSMGGSNSGNTLSSGGGSTSSMASSNYAAPTAEDMMNLPNNVLAQIAQQYANGEANPPKPPTASITSQFAQEGQQQRPGQPQGDGGSPRYVISEESWKHHAQARAILGNLIGPNGEQLTSTDPYNTTVFVGGLSPLISEDTLRTFFAPFGDIHYVKVPVGKHCGFVQFVRKADAERAIEKMQGFPVGGSRIRLSWGRSQYKAAQAAAQAAQAAAMQPPVPMPPALPANPLTQEQAMQLLQSFQLQGYASGAANSDINGKEPANTGYNAGPSAGLFAEEKLRAALLASREDASHSYNAYTSAGYPNRSDDTPSPLDPRQSRSHNLNSFSPFSPDPNLYSAELKRRESLSFQRAEPLPHPSKAYAPGFFSLQPDDFKVNDIEGDRVSPTSARPPSAPKYGSYVSSSPPALQVNRAPGRPETHPISRPTSGQTVQPRRELDGLHDLNGTLASLNLDRERAWKSPAEGSESSGASVQFRISMESTPSP